MKFFFICTTLFFLSFSQTSNDSCSIEIQKEQLLESQILLSCPEFNNNEALIIKGFSIKFPGHPTEVINGVSLNSNTRSYLKSMQKDDIIAIFDIKEAKTQSGKIIANTPSFLIKVIE